MPEHYTRNTETATLWCAKCRKITTHRVDGGRRSPCLDPQHPEPKPSKPKGKPPAQKNLFEGTCLKTIK